jgi:UDP-N-acetylglucosamine--N-acetylmuramyl-(pentapeptide) pyrophosphoryl-undecaprenol N-acetylglucosamine transferase
MSGRVLIVAGGTGGHVFPALCLYKKLQKCRVDFGTDRRGATYLDKDLVPVLVQNINTSCRLRLYLSLLYNIAGALIFLLKNKYDIVIGFGGYPSIPLTLSAQILGIRTIVHEQNAVVGKANKLLLRFAFRIVTSFKNTKGLRENKKIVHIGNPTRFEDIYDDANIRRDDSFTILIFGGSQGARIFSDNVADAVCSVSHSRRIGVIHQCPTLEIERTKRKYNEYNINHVIAPFFHDMAGPYQKADLVISRSGASSVFEIIGFKKPAILIPYANSINGDQMENAKFLESKGAAILMEEGDGLKTGIENALVDLIDNRSKLEGASRKLKELYTPRIADLFRELLESCLPSR